MITMRPNRAGFQRLRTLAEAVKMSDADRSGPALTILNQVHVKQVRQAFTSRGASVAGGPWPAWSERYAVWRRKNTSRFGRSMMRLRGAYRGRAADQLFRKSTMPGAPDYVGQWLGRLRYAFGFRDDVGFFHDPTRSIIRKTARQHREFVAAFVRFYRARIRQIARAVR